MHAYSGRACMPTVDDHDGINVDAGVEAHPDRPSTPQHLSTAVSSSTVLFMASSDFIMSSYNLSLP